MVCTERRRLPQGWSIVEGVDERAANTVIGPSPVIDQTRAMARQMFAVQLTERRHLHFDPIVARDDWLEQSRKRGDHGMVRIIEQLDLEAFAGAWQALVYRLRHTGVEATVQWLENQR